MCFHQQFVSDHAQQPCVIIFPNFVHHGRHHLMAHATCIMPTCTRVSQSDWSLDLRWEKLNSKRTLLDTLHLSWKMVNSLKQHDPRIWLEEKTGLRQRRVKPGKSFKFLRDAKKWESNLTFFMVSTVRIIAVLQSNSDTLLNWKHWQAQRTKDVILQQQP